MSRIVIVTVYVLFIVYVTLPPGIGPIAAGNKYILHTFLSSFVTGGFSKTRGVRSLVT
jgi:hypothetical protein